MPFFSVVIPLYNKENFIGQTIDSVLSQSFADFEIIVVDDCSTDNSLSVALKFTDPRIKIVRAERNAGLSASRNTGIRNATSEFIAFLDADDTWKEGFLGEIKTLIDVFPESALFATGYEEVYPDIILSPEFNREILQKRSVIGDFFAYNLGQPIYCPSSLCVRKSAFDTIGFYDETIRFGEDVDFNIRANLSFKLAYSTENLVAYRMFSENQITNSPLRGKKITDFDAYETDAAKNPALKKYLDFHRYVMAKHYKKENDHDSFAKMVSGIHPNPKISGLNLKQRLLLHAPAFVLDAVRKIKKVLLKKGIRPTTYR